MYNIDQLDLIIYIAGRKAYIWNWKPLQDPSSDTPRLLSHMTYLNIEAGNQLDMCNDYQKMYEVNFRML